MVNNEADILFKCNQTRVQNPALENVRERLLMLEAGFSERVRTAAAWPLLYHLSAFIFISFSFFIYLIIIILSLKARRIYFLENMYFAFSPMCASLWLEFCSKD